MEYNKELDHPSNGISIVGCLRPAFVDEEPYLRRVFAGDDSYTSAFIDEEPHIRRLFGHGDSDDNMSNWKGIL